MILEIDIDLTKQQITDYLSSVLSHDSEYDELYKREELITMVCLQESSADEQELKEMFERILTKFRIELSKKDFNNWNS